MKALEDITVRDILGEDFFCNCPEPIETWQGHLHEGFFATEYRFSRKCGRCGHPMELELVGERL